MQKDEFSEQIWKFEFLFLKMALFGIVFGSIYKSVFSKEHR